MRYLYVFPGVTLPSEGKPDDVVVHRVDTLDQVPAKRDALVPLSIWKSAEEWHSQQVFGPGPYLNVWIPEGADEKEANTAADSDCCFVDIQEGTDWKGMLNALAIEDIKEGQA